MGSFPGVAWRCLPSGPPVGGMTDRPATSASPWFPDGATRVSCGTHPDAVRGGLRSAAWSGDPEYGIKNLLVRNLEHLSPAQFAKIASTLQADPAGQEIAAAWIGKEKLRHALNLRARVTGSVPCERNVRDRLFAFYDWCACNDDIPELLSLAKTVSRWENEIVCAVLTGVTNAA